MHRSRVSIVIFESNFGSANVLAMLLGIGVRRIKYRYAAEILSRISMDN
jgi:hypothetical protein